jgi:DNA-binding response OmpR family regulator
VARLLFRADIAITSDVKPHILFVDDEADWREMLTLYFKHNGLEVSTAATVAEAKNCLDHGFYKLVVLDLNLAGEDGLEVLRYVKGRSPQVPVVVFTGLDVDENLVKRCLADRVDGFMRKTGGLESLLTEVRRHLPSLTEMAP